MEVAPDPQALAEQVMVHFLAAAHRSLAERDSFRVAVSGGRTPRLFFDLLGRSDAGRALPWERIHLFWTDERYVPWDSGDSNYKLLADTLLAQVSIPAGNVHAVATAYPDMFDAVRAYEQTLREVFHVEGNAIPSFDLVLLGMGADGHTASLFPGTYAPFDTEDWVCAVFKSGGDVNRITLTHPVLRAARQLLVVVSGADKAETLKAVVNEAPDADRYPIHLLWPVLEKVTWLVDKDSLIFDV
jgi:6-phosphogluconolactonase